MDEIGQKLRTARIEKGYTLDDLQQITKIQKRYLIAIEEGNFDALPGDFYVRAFIKQYADTVGIDSAALLTQFQQDIPDTQPQEYVEQSVENKTRKTRASESSPKNTLRRYLPQFVIVVIAIVILGGIYAFILTRGQSEKTAIPDNSSSISVSDKKTTKSTASKSTSSSAKAKSSSSASKKSSSSKKDDKLSVAVGADSNAAQAVTVKNWPTTANTVTVGATTKAAWVAVMINGATTWQGSLSAGATHTVSLPAGTTAFSVKSGNATATSIKLNDTNVDISAGTSYVRTIKFTTESAGN